MAGKTKIIDCFECGNPKEVRIADIKRGWGRYCSKSCAVRGRKRKRTRYIRKEWDITDETYWNDKDW